MKIISRFEQMQTWRSELSHHKKVGFVPTMGALHEGHLALIKRCQKENDLTVVSIFVNPIQFGPNEDFNRYPRPWKNDVKKLKETKVHILFAPDQNSMYPSGRSTQVEVKALNHMLCGSPQFRGSSHFNGVATVVAKLFNLVRPTRAYFGLKDYQQVRVIEQMNWDLNMGVKIVRCPTVREEDGLAKSSRNSYLSLEERRVAPLFYAALQRGRKLLTSHPKVRPQQVCQEVLTALSSMPNSKVEYVELVDPNSLQKRTSSERPALLAAAIRLGKTRLIDNILIN